METLCGGTWNHLSCRRRTFFCLCYPFLRALSSLWLFATWRQWAIWFNLRNCRGLRKITAFKFLQCMKLVNFSTLSENKCLYLSSFSFNRYNWDNYVNDLGEWFRSREIHPWLYLRCLQSVSMKTTKIKMSKGVASSSFKFCFKSCDTTISRVQCKRQQRFI